MKNNLIKFILISIITGSSLLFGENTVAPRSSEIRRFCIANISNLNNDQITIDKNNIKINIDQVRGFALEKPLVIPFISIKHYLKQYVKDIPFVPEHAIKILTKNKQLYLWQNESGIICAPNPKNLTISEDWKAQRIFDPNNAQGKANLNLFCLRLIVKNRDKIKLKEI